MKSSSIVLFLFCVAVGGNVVMAQDYCSLLKMLVGANDVALHKQFDVPGSQSIRTSIPVLKTIEFDLYGIVVDLTSFDIADCSQSPVDGSNHIQLHIDFTNLNVHVGWHWHKLHFIHFKGSGSAYVHADPSLDVTLDLSSNQVVQDSLSLNNYRFALHSNHAKLFYEMFRKVIAEHVKPLVEKAADSFLRDEADKCLPNPIACVPSLESTLALRK